jgi:SH3 domain protein
VSWPKRIVCRVALVLLVLAGSTSRPAAAEYIDGEVRAHLRSGPGLEFRILKILPAGTVAQRLGSDGEWVRVRVGDLEGWLPSGSLSSEEPAILSLPKVREKLSSAESRIAELDQKLGAQAAQLAELTTLKERNQVLEADLSAINANARWKSLTAGAGIVLVGILIGLVAPRGGAQRSRLKL